MLNSGDFPWFPVTGPITSPWSIGWIRPDSPIHLTWVTVRNHSGSVVVVNHWMIGRINWKFMAFGYVFLDLWDLLDDPGGFFCVSNPFLATHISQRWILSASFSDVTLFSWRISTKKSRVLFNIQWNSGDWTLEGTRREPEGKTRRENPKGKPEGKTRRIAEISPRLSPHHFVSCDGGHVFF